MSATGIEGNGAGLRAEARPSVGILTLFVIPDKAGRDGLRPRPRLFGSVGTFSGGRRGPRDRSFPHPILSPPGRPCPESSRSRRARAPDAAAPAAKRRPSARSATPGRPARAADAAAPVRCGAGATAPVGRRWLGGLAGPARPRRRRGARPGAGRAGGDEFADLVASAREPAQVESALVALAGALSDAAGSS